jgi:hypothetical protein
MRTLLRIALALVCLLILGGGGTARAQLVDRYVVSGKATLTGASRTITIVGNGKRLELEQFSVQPYATGGVTVAIERDCSSVTTTTALPKRAINAETTPGTASFLAYDTSAATGCTALSPDWIVPDMGLLPVPAARTYNNGGSGRNINLRITPLAGSTLTGTLRYQITLTEAR